jgi:hypothetical protein
MAVRKGSFGYGRMLSDHRLWLLMASGFLGVACRGPSTPPDQVSDEVFVQVMTRLVLIDSDSPRRSPQELPEAAADSAREELLAEYGVSAAELLHFASRAGRDPRRMERVWVRIAAAVDSVRAERRESGAEEGPAEPLGKLGLDAAEADASAEDSAGGADTSRVPPGAAPADIRRSMKDRASRDSIRRLLKPPGRDTTRS